LHLRKSHTRLTNQKFFVLWNRRWLEFYRANNNHNNNEILSGDGSRRGRDRLKWGSGEAPEGLRNKCVSGPRLSQNNYKIVRNGHERDANGSNQTVDSRTFLVAPAKAGVQGRSRRTRRSGCPLPAGMTVRRPTTNASRRGGTISGQRAILSPRSGSSAALARTFVDWNFPARRNDSDVRVQRNPRSSIRL
jgi:hypothetical protein